MELVQPSWSVSSELQIRYFEWRDLFSHVESTSNSISPPSMGNFTSLTSFTGIEANPSIRIFLKKVTCTLVRIVKLQKLQKEWIVNMKDVPRCGENFCFPVIEISAILSPRIPRILSLWTDFLIYRRRLRPDCSKRFFRWEMVFQRWWRFHILQIFFTVFSDIIVINCGIDITCLILFKNYFEATQKFCRLIKLEMQSKFWRREVHRF